MSGITRNAKVFVNSIFELMRTVGVSEEKVTEMQPKLVELVEDFTQRLDQVDKEISGQKDIINALIQNIAGLEKKMKQYIYHHGSPLYQHHLCQLLISLENNISSYS